MVNRYNFSWPAMKNWTMDYRSVTGVKPIKGVDYWTEEDRKEIVDDAVQEVWERGATASFVSDEKSVTIRFGGKDGGI